LQFSFGTLQLSHDTDTPERSYFFRLTYSCSRSHMIADFHSNATGGKH
jgi:hypothetical protein